MKEIKFDFNNMFSFNIGKAHGITDDELKSISKDMLKAHEHLQKIIADKEARVEKSLEWAVLPFQSPQMIRRIQELGKRISRKYENVLFLGIGGSYLGLKAAQDALAPPYYNDFKKLRNEIELK